MGYAQVSIEVTVKLAAHEIFVVLFVTLVVVCAFHGPDSHASDASSSQEGDTFCGFLHSSVVQATPPSQRVSDISSDEPVGLLPEVRPAWILARSIDHPPELPV
jgi:hypothetical protein